MPVYYEFPHRQFPAGTRFERPIRSIAHYNRQAVNTFVRLSPSRDCTAGWFELFANVAAHEVAARLDRPPRDIVAELAEHLSAAASDPVLLDDLLAPFPRGNAVCRTDTRYITDEQIVRLTTDYCARVDVGPWDRPGFSALLSLTLLTVLGASDCVQRSSNPPAFRGGISYNQIHQLELMRVTELDLALFEVKDAVKPVDLQIPAARIASEKLTTVTLRAMIEERLSTLELGFLNLRAKLNNQYSTLRLTMAAVALDGGIEDWTTVADSNAAAFLRADWTFWQLARTLVVSGALQPAAALTAIPSHLLESRLTRLGSALASLTLITFDPLQKLASEVGYRRIKNMRGELVRIFEVARVKLMTEPVFARMFRVYHDYVEPISADSEQMIARSIFQPHHLLDQSQIAQENLVQSAAEQTHRVVVGQLNVDRTPAPHAHRGRLASALLAARSVVSSVVPTDADFYETAASQLLISATIPDDTAILFDPLPGQQVHFDPTDEDELLLLSSLLGRAVDSQQDVLAVTMDYDFEVNQKLLNLRLYSPGANPEGFAALNVEDWGIHVEVPELNYGEDDPQFVFDYNFMSDGLGYNPTDVLVVQHPGIVHAARLAFQHLIEAAVELHDQATDNDAVSEHALLGAHLLSLYSTLIKLPAVESAFHVLRGRLSAANFTPGARRELIARIDHSGLWAVVKMRLALAVLGQVYGVRQAFLTTLEDLFAQHQTVRTAVLIEGRLG